MGRRALGAGDGAPAPAADVLVPGGFREQRIDLLRLGSYNKEVINILAMSIRGTVRLEVGGVMRAKPGSRGNV